jgi:poly-gamma-glutamate synthesis protein (capsule biosynthesis protein)
MSVRLMAVGDIALRRKPEGRDPFEFVKETLGEADLVFGNLEVPLTSAREPVEEKAEPLRAPVEQSSYLSAANFSVVNLANNHIGDYGPAGVLETIDSLQRAGIGHVGVGRTVTEAVQEVVRTVGGVTVAFIGFYEYGAISSSDGVYIAGMDRQLVVHRIAELAKRCAFVVASLHWGIENVSYPSPEQQSLARACVDAGASVLVGHHPHCLQGIEVREGRVIFYSLGNFNFMCDGDAKKSCCDLTAIADVTLHDDGTVSHELIAARIGDDYCPRPITDRNEMAEFRVHMERISAVLERGVETWWWFGEIGGTYLAGNLKAFGIRIRRYGLRHAIEMVQWLTGRFALKCCVGMIRRRLRRRA